MKTYTLTDINQQCRTNPDDFVLTCEHEYQIKLEQAAKEIIESGCPVILLNGPSSSGKTTTAGKLAKELKKRGLTTYAISMDDYYRSHDSYTVPLDEYGRPDLESPLCMDLPLLAEHLKKLAAGEPIDIPKFDFEHKCRSNDTERVVLRLGEAAVIEGIHAFNDTITGPLEDKAYGLYIAVQSQLELSPGVIIPPRRLRFPRRAVRDFNFRGSSVSYTLGQWRSVLRGEGLYIKPYVGDADLTLDTYLPYEDCVLFPRLKPHLLPLREEAEEAGVSDIYAALDLFEPLPTLEALPKESLLREFVG